MGNADRLMQLIRERSSTRGYRQTPVEPEKTERILEAARLAPSACNTQGWRFIVTSRPEVLSELVSRGLGGMVPNRWAATAPVIITGCFEPGLNASRAGSAVKGIDYYQVDMGIAGDHMTLMARALGLGTCWIGWFNQKQVRKVLKIPRGWKIVFLMTLGYPAEGSEKEKNRVDLEKIAFRDVYGNTW